MRILLMTPFLTIGGADRLNLDVVQQLARRGFRFSVVATLPHAHEWRPLFESITPDVVTLHPTIAPEQQPAFVCDLIRSRDIQTLLISNSQFGYALLPYLRRHCPDVVVLDLICCMRWKRTGSMADIRNSRSSSAPGSTSVSRCRAICATG